MNHEPPTLNQKLGLIMRVGTLMLENGAATYRVEETLSRMGQSLELARLEIFATPTGLIIEADTIDGASASHVSRIGTMTVNMNQLVLLSDLSREAASGGLTYEQIAERISAIERQGALYPDWLVLVGVSMACGAFALLFGGGWREFTATLFGAALGMLVRIGLRSVRLVPLMVTAAAAFVATASGSLGCQVLACAMPEAVPISAVLQLVPGVLMVTGAIDLATGDILSGLARSAYAAVIAFGIASGMLLFLAWGL